MTVEKKETGQLFLEAIDGTCSGVLAYATTSTVDLSLTGQSSRSVGRLVKDDRRYFAQVVVVCGPMRPEPDEKSVEEGTFGGTKEKTVEEDTSDQGGGQN
jgi:hypothetical protein